MSKSRFLSNAAYAALVVIVAGAARADVSISTDPIALYGACLHSNGEDGYPYLLANPPHWACA